MQDSDNSQEVTVYNYVPFGNIHKPRLPAAFKAPREQIESTLNGKVLEGTAEKVRASQLDHEGRYRRRATGWGDLS